MKTDRMARVNKLIRTVLAELLPEIRDPRVQQIPILSITDVRTSPDLIEARVFMSMLGSPEEQDAALEALARASGFLRAQLGRQIRLRRIPELRFVRDATQDNASRIEGILSELAGPKDDHE